MRKKNKVLWTIGVVLVLLAGALFLPLRAVLEAKLISALQARGFPLQAIHIDHVGFTYATLTDVTFGEKNPLQLKRLNLTYNFQELWEGRLRHLTLDDLTLELEETPKGWQWRGMPEGDEKAPPFTLPVSTEALKLPFQKLEFNNCRLRLVSKEISGEIPFSGTLEHEENWQLRLQSGAAEFHKAPYMLTLGEAVLQATLDEKKKSWVGEAQLKNVQVNGTPQPLPSLNLSLPFVLSENKAVMNVKWRDELKNWRGAASLTIPYDAPANARMSVSEAGINAAGGRLTLSTKPFTFSGSQPVSVIVNAEKLRLADLLALLAEEKITATGEVSGSVPFSISRKGELQPDIGKLESLSEGVVSMQPGIIPANNDQTRELTTLLQNFHYTRASLDVTKNALGKPLIRLRLEGNNPEALAGRAVNLNVNLGGDIIPLIRQSIMPVNDPKTWLRENHAD